MELTIYIIDDDLVSQFASRYCIEQTNSNCRIIIFDSAEKALDKLYNLDPIESDFPDVLFLDLIMGGMDGWRFLDKFQQIVPNPKRTKIYLLSAFVNSKDREIAKQHPMIHGYYDKPLSKRVVNEILLQKTD